MPISLQERIEKYTKGSGTFINEKFWHAVLGYWLTEDEERAEQIYKLAGLLRHKENLVFHSPAKSINSDLLIVTPREFALIEVKVSGRWQHYQRMLYAHQIHNILIREPELFKERTPVLIVVGRDKHLKKFPVPSGLFSTQHQAGKEHRILTTYHFVVRARCDEDDCQILDCSISLHIATRNPNTKKAWREKDEKKLSMLQTTVGKPFHLEVRLLSWEKIQFTIGKRDLPLESFWL